jgi:hypothetical protein
MNSRILEFEEYVKQYFFITYSDDLPLTTQNEYMQSYINYFRDVFDGMDDELPASPTW